MLLSSQEDVVTSDNVSIMVHDLLSFNEIISNYIDVEQVTISGNSSVIVNNNIQLTASIYPENASNATVTWTSSNSNIATISQNGLLSAVSEGIVTITATSVNGVSGTKTISVTNPQTVMYYGYAT